jgi:hypothetical protein
MGMTIHPKRRHLYIGVESANGTWLGTATVMVIGNATVPHEKLKFSPTVEYHERDLDGNSLQQPKAEPGAASGKATFTTRLIAPASKGLAGPLSPLFKALGLSETLVASTSATYVENPSSMTTLSIGVGLIREDGTVEVEYGLAGCRVSALTIKASGGGKIIECEWEVYGKLAYETAVLVAVDDASPNSGITYVDDSAQGFKFMGITARTGLFARDISNFEFSVGRSVELGIDIGDLSCYDYGHLGKTKPTLKLDPSKVTIATANDLATLRAGSTFAAAMTATAPNGATFAFSAPNAQVRSMSDDARGEAVSVWGVTAELARSLGSGVDASDAWQIVFA